MTHFKGVSDIKTSVMANVKTIEKRNFQSASGHGQDGWQSVWKNMANILKGTIMITLEL